MNSFHNQWLYLLCEAWKEYNGHRLRYERFKNHSNGMQLESERKLTDLWRDQEHILCGDWQGFVESSLTERWAKDAFHFLLHCRGCIRRLWFVRGGFFYTADNHLRREDIGARINRGLVPEVPEDLQAGIEAAEWDWAKALDAESANVKSSWWRRKPKRDGDFQAQLTGILLAASGTVTRIERPKRMPWLWGTRLAQWWEKRDIWLARLGLKTGWLMGPNDWKRVK